MTNYLARSYSFVICQRSVRTSPMDFTSQALAVSEATLWILFQVCFRSRIVHQFLLMHQGQSSLNQDKLRFPTPAYASFSSFRCTRSGFIAKSNSISTISILTIGAQICFLFQMLWSLHFRHWPLSHTSCRVCRRTDGCTCVSFWTSLGSIGRVWPWLQ